MENLKPLNDLKRYLPFKINKDIKSECSEYSEDIDKYSPYSLSDCITSLLLLKGELISQVHFMKTGRAQSVYVDRKFAMELFNRVNYIRINNKPLILTAYNNSTSRTHKTKDGFIELTTTLRHLHEEVLTLLDSNPTYDAVAKKFLEKTADEWEIEVNAANIGGQKIRSREEFRAHPQGKALLQEDPFKVEKLNDRPAKPFNPEGRPLEGIKVLDLTLIIAGPSIGNFLAEQGAEVLHIANPNGERVPSNYIDTGFGKRCAYLDLNAKEDLQQFWNLLEEADIYVSSYAPHRLEEKFGITQEQVLAKNPDIIMLAHQAFGPNGPWQKHQAWENIAQAAIGSALDHGDAERPFLCPYGFPTDYGTGLMGTIGIIAALINRAEHGGAQKVSVSLARTGMWIQDQGVGPHPNVDEVIKFGLETVTKSHVSQNQIVTKTNYGEITHLGPIIQYSETPGRWDHPTPILGEHLPEWLK